MIKILQTVDALLYEAILWIVLTPKTILKVIISPRWIVNYVRRELEKNPEDRYASYMPPVTFFVLLGVLPVITLRNLNLAFIETWWLLKLSGPTPESQVLLYALYTALGPLLFSLSILKLKRHPIDRVSLKSTFHAQCFVWAIVFAAYVIRTLIWGRLWGSAPFGPFQSLHVLTDYAMQTFIMAWLFYAETFVISDDLRTSRAAGFGFAFAILFGFGLLAQIFLVLIRLLN